MKIRFFQMEEKGNDERKITGNQGEGFRTD